MSINKKIVCPLRTRCIPDQFSWVDQRLVREGYMGRCSAEALALYLFYLVVSDAQGVSYYADSTISRLIPLTEAEVSDARKVLHAAGLIAFRRPVVQVLGLDLPIPAPHALRDQRADVEVNHD